MISPGELLTAHLALLGCRGRGCLAGQPVVLQPGRDDEGLATELAPVGSVQAALLLVSVHRLLAAHLLPAALAVVALLPRPLQSLVKVCGLYVTPDSLLAVHGQLTHGAVEELDRQSVLPPPPHTSQRLLVQEAQRCTH